MSDDDNSTQGLFSYIDDCNMQQSKVEQDAFDETTTAAASCNIANVPVSDPFEIEVEIDGSVSVEVEVEINGADATNEIDDESGSGSDSDSESDTEESEKLRQEMEENFVKSEKAEAEKKNAMRLLLGRLQQKPQASHSKHKRFDKIPVQHRRQRISVNPRKRMQHKLKTMGCKNMNRQNPMQILRKEPIFANKEEDKDVIPSDTTTEKTKLLVKDLNKNHQNKNKIENKKIEDDDEDEDEDEEIVNLNLDYETATKVVPGQCFKYVEIAAVEENSNGEIIDNNDSDSDDDDIDEHFKQFGIVKGLLATKKDCLIGNNNEMHEKRAMLHQQLLQVEDTQNLNLMQEAFINGNYRQLQNANKKLRDTSLATLNEATKVNEGEMSNPAVKHSNNNNNNTKLLTKTAMDYLSDNDEKNDYCVYNKNGEFNSIFRIQARILEWDRIKNKENKEQEQEQEIDRAELLRLKRVHRKEQLSRQCQSQSQSQSLQLNEEMQSQSQNQSQSEHERNILQIIRKNKQKPKLKQIQIQSNKMNDADFSKFLKPNKCLKLKKGTFDNQNQIFKKTSFSVHSNKIQKLKLKNSNNFGTEVIQNNKSNSNSKRYVFGQNNAQTQQKKKGKVENRKRKFEQSSTIANDSRQKRRKL